MCFLSRPIPKYSADHDRLYLIFIAFHTWYGTTVPFPHGRTTSALSHVQAARYRTPRNMTGIFSNSDAEAISYPLRDQGHMSGNIVQNIRDGSVRSPVAHVHLALTLLLGKNVI